MQHHRTLQARETEHKTDQIKLMMQITQAFEKEPVINEALPQTNVTGGGNFEQTC